MAFAEFPVFSAGPAFIVPVSVVDVWPVWMGVAYPTMPVPVRALILEGMVLVRCVIMIVLNGRVDMHMFVLLTEQQ